MSGHKPSPVLGRTGSDGLINLIRATAAESKQWQNLSNRSESASDKLSTHKRKATSPALPLANGSHNGASVLHTSASVRKSPLMPPTHRLSHKSNSSDSNSSIKSDSSGSVFRPTAQSSNQDGQLSDHSSSSLNLGQDHAPKVKRPLLPPTAGTTSGGVRPHVVSSDDSARRKTKPLPSPPARSQSPGNPVTNTDTEESETEIRQCEDEAFQDRPKLGQTVSNQDAQQSDVHGLLDENDALKRKIFLLEQQQHNLKQENHLLRQNLVATHTGNSSSGSNTPTGRSCTVCGNGSSPSCLGDGGTHSPSPSPSSPVQTPASTDERRAPDAAKPDPKLAAKAQLARVIERAKASSFDTADPAILSQPISKSVPQPQSQSVPEAEQSPHPPVTSPLSPAISTPSPSSLVSFGLASQAKRKKDAQQDSHDAEDGEQIVEQTVDRQIANKPIPAPRKARKVEEPKNLPPQNDAMTEHTSSRPEGSDAPAPHAEDEVVRQAKPGKFTSQTSSKSIVATTTKLFQGSSVGNQVTTKKSGNTNQQVRTPNSSPQTDRVKESVSSECDDVFSSREKQEGVAAMQQQQSQHRTMVTESQVGPGTESGEKMGVVSKKNPVKSDGSWIKLQLANQSDGTDGDGNGGSESPADVLSSSPTVRPYRSHQILNTCSPPPPPSQAAKPTTPRTFHATSRLASPVLSKSPANRHQSRDNEHRSDCPPPDPRGRGVSISNGNRLKSKRKGNLRESETGMTRSASDESLQGTVKRGIQAYSSHREEPSSNRPSADKRPTRPPPMTRNTSNGRVNGRPASVLVASGPAPKAWEGSRREEDFTVSCTVPSTLPSSHIDKSPKPKFKKSSDHNLLTKKGSIFGRLKVKTRDKDLPSTPVPALAEEDGGDTESSSEDETGGTIKRKPRLRPVSVRRPSQVEDDFDLSYPHLFERVFVVGLKHDPGSKKLVTEVTYTFPPRPSAETAKDETMEAIPQFCFPDIDRLKPTTKPMSETFSFVLTNMEGQRRFGYCRRMLPSGQGSRLPEVTCLISPLGCFSLYAKILDHIEARRQVSTAAVFTFLKAIVANPFPKPGRSVEVRAISARGGGMETVKFTRPLDSRLEHVNLSLLFTTLSPRKIIQIFSSVLMERRIILCSSNLNLLTGCAHALLALLYPFEWQHVFIPILPGALIDFCCSPLPYIIGMNPSLIPSLDQMDTMEEALVVDLDKKKFAKKIGDEVSILPSKLFQYLEHALSSSVIAGDYHKSPSKRTTPCRADEIIINTFMIFFVYLYGDYKRYMKSGSDGTVEFQKKEYERKFSSKSIRRFLEAFHMTQMFDSFIEERENPLKADTTAQSTFERRSIHELKERCTEIEIFSSKSKISRWRLRKRM